MIIRQGKALRNDHVIHVGLGIRIIPAIQTAPELQLATTHHNKKLKRDKLGTIIYRHPFIKSIFKTANMGDVAIENPANVVPPHKRQPPSNSIPNVDSLEGINNDDSDEYSTLKKLQRHLEYIRSSTNI